MLKTLLPGLPLAVFLSAAPAFAAEARDEGLAREALIKLNANTVFLRTASRIVEEGASPEARGFLKMAEGFAAEGKAHFDSGDYRLAIEDIDESTNDAINSIILTKNADDAAVRDLVMQEGLLMRERHDRARKEAMVAKRIEEVETFIKTAEKLLAGKSDGDARVKIEESKRLYDASRAALMAHDYDSALNDINSAYRLATGAVKEIKSAQNDIITFPKPPKAAGEKDMLSYELKKNDAYVFFAGQVVKGEEAESIFSSGKEEKTHAMKAVESGDVKGAIERLRASTEMIIKAINESIKK